MTTPASASTLPACSADVLARIVALIGAHFPWVSAAGELSAETLLRTDLDLDSLHMVELQVSIEDHFGVEFDPNDEHLLDAFVTVGSLGAYAEYLLQRDM